MLVPLSRLYLGAHSADQVVLGLLFDLCFVILYRYKLQEWGYKVLECLLVRRKSIFELFLILSSLLACLIVPYVAFNIRLANTM